MDKFRFLLQVVFLGVLFCALSKVSFAQEKYFVWAFSCPHQPAEFPRLPVTEAFGEIPQDLAPDLVVMLGDFHTAGSDVEGDQQTTAMVWTDLQALDGIPWIVVAGNHDTVGSSAWFRETFPNVAWPHYEEAFGNVDFLVWHDRNDMPYPQGGIDSVAVGGHPSMTVTRSSLNWAKRKINQSISAGRNPIILSHATPRDTVLASSPGEGFGFHSLDHAIPDGAGALWSVADWSWDGTGFSWTFDDGTFDFHGLGAVAHLSGHTHAKRLENINGKRRERVVEGTFYQNVGHLTANHIAPGREARTHSTVYEFTVGSKTVVCHGINHIHPFRAAGVQEDWERSFELAEEFEFE